MNEEVKQVIYRHTGRSDSVLEVRASRRQPVTLSFARFATWLPMQHCHSPVPLDGSQYASVRQDAVYPSGSQ